MKKQILAYFKRLIKREATYTPLTFIGLLGIFAIFSGNTIAYISSPNRWIETFVFTLIVAFARAFIPDDRY